MMYNSYFKERRNHGFLYKLRDKCPGWHKILYLMWYADVGTGTTASPPPPQPNLCAAANLRLSHYRSRLMPRHRNRLTHNLNRDTWLRRAIRTLPDSPGKKYEPITTGGYIGIFLLMLLPLINLILLIIWPAELPEGEQGELRPCDADHDDNRFGLVVADVLRRTDAVR